MPALLGEVWKVANSDGETLLGSLATAGTAGAVTVGLAWLACARAVADSRRFGAWLLVLCVILWVTPGPLVGLGLKDTIAWLVELEARLGESLGVADSVSPLAAILYNQPSPVPAMWATVIRLFPVAVAILWPVTRAIPRDLWDAAKLDGLGFADRWQRVVVPLTAPAAIRAWLAVSALALGEVSASKLVNPPGRDAYVLRLFDQMHYGAESTVAALCLLQLGVMLLLGGLALWWFRSPQNPT